MSKKIYISIDFEMMWGLIGLDPKSIAVYAHNIHSECESLQFMLSLQKKYNVACTYATVGAISLSSWEEYFDTVKKFPKYQNTKYSIIEHRKSNKYSDELYFRPDAISQIIENDYSELASHSFSHLYYGEKGVAYEDFSYDNITFNEVFENKYNIYVRSFVYPRNQIKFENELSKFGLKCYRGGVWSNFGTSALDGFILFRLLRLFDGLFGINKLNFNRTQDSIPATHFIRFNLPDILWRYQLLKIEKAAINLKDGQHLHLWWHPHNLSTSNSIPRERCIYLFEFLRSLADKFEIKFAFMSKPELH